jgi:esterase/lipase superfamily enzyme
MFIRKYGTLLNGSTDYVPVIVLLLFCGAWTWIQTSHPHLVVAGVLSAASLVCRVIDNDVEIASGTHFMWHTLNGFLMAMLTMFIAVYIEV